MHRLLRCISVSVFFALAAGTFVPQRSAAQTYGEDSSADSAAGKNGYTVSGTVVNSVTGEPISRALVQTGARVATADHAPTNQQEADALAELYRQRTALTDREGRFKFVGLPKMKAGFMVRKPGFFSLSELGDDAFLSGQNRVNVGVETPPVVLKLVPEAIITGRVTDANGEPLEGVSVRISGLQHANGRKQLSPLMQDQEEPQTWTTNEEGDYRVAGLMPGNYYVSAVPYSSNHDQPQSMGIPKVAYPITYYPGVAELNEATTLQLSAGQRAEIDFTIRPAPVIVVSGLLTGLGRAQDVDLQFTNESGDDVSLDKQFDAQTGSFQAHIIAAGPCVIKADAKDAFEHLLHGQLTLTATASVKNVRLNLAPALSIPIEVRMETTKPRSTPEGTLIRLHNGGTSIPVSVNLHPIEMGRPQLSASVEGGPNNPVLVLRNLEPGRYNVEVIPNNTENDSWYVKSILYGGADLLREELTVVPGQASAMEIVLRDDSAAIYGTVQSGEDEGQTAAVLVVSDYAPLDPKMIVADDRGEFQLDGLAPGGYKVFAFDRVDGLEYSNPQALDPYVSKAAQVSLQPNEKTTVKVDLIQRGE
jgi:protocatechuate 3,4-dioxygenase beta subunit